MRTAGFPTLLHASVSSATIVLAFYCSELGSTLHQHNPGLATARSFSNCACVCVAGVEPAASPFQAGSSISVDLHADKMGSGFLLLLGLNPIVASSITLVYLERFELPHDRLPKQVANQTSPQVDIASFL